MKVSEILDAAADKLAAPGAWTQGAEAFDANGRIVVATSPEACKWCWRGAMVASDPGFVTAVASAMHFVRWNLPDYLESKGRSWVDSRFGVTGFNDQRCTTQDLVVQTSRDLAAMARSVGR
jgi:hypothetical protein